MNEYNFSVMCQPGLAANNVVTVRYLIWLIFGSGIKLHFYSYIIFHSSFQITSVSVGSSRIFPTLTNRHTIKPMHREILRMFPHSKIIWSVVIERFYRSKPAVEGELKRMTKPPLINNLSKGSSASDIKRLDLIT